MKFLFVMTLFFPGFVFAESISGRWKVDSVLCLQGDEGSCPKNFSELSVEVSQNPLQLCSEFVYENGTPNSSNCITSYENSDPNSNPVKEVVNKRKISLSADGSQLWSVLTKQSDGERVVYTYSLHRHGSHMVIYDYIYWYRFDESAKRWKRTSSWKKHHYLSLQ